ncbi:MAG: hypothetical protein JXA87_00405 [Thermoleophilia bacterium]|nr:hypothetical protein [Thermoleophilia bacterium]
MRQCTRWCYWSAVAPLWNRPRPFLHAQCWPGNAFLIARMAAERPREGVPFMMVESLPDYHLLRPNVVAIPVRVADPEAAGLASSVGQGSLIPEKADGPPRANLATPAKEYLAALGQSEVDRPDVAGLLWTHVLATGYSQLYLSENLDEVQRDWPRIPLPNSKDLLLASAELGRKVADLLDPETEVDGVTSGSVRPELKVVGMATRVDGLPLNERAGDLAVTAGWGHAGQGGVTMPGKGKTVTRPWTSEERTTIEQGSEALGLSAQEAFAQLGNTAVDVYLNDVAYWRGVPAGVWSYTIGGYQVMKKWLSYREKPLLGRDLRREEMREVTYMVRRIAAILLMQPALDANYQAVKENTYVWPQA